MVGSSPEAIRYADKEENRNFIGIELNKEYFDIAQARIGEKAAIC